MQSGDPCVVTNMNGETAEGTIREIFATTVGEYEVDFLSAEGATLLDYWRGHDVDPDAPVVAVDLEGGTYHYPADRVEVTDGGD